MSLLNSRRFALLRAVASRQTWLAAALALSTASGGLPAWGGSIFGTLSNFDIYNTTPEPSEGAEIELEGVHPEDIGGFFLPHYADRSVAEYFNAQNQFAGTRVTYTNYNFAEAPTPGSLLPNPNPTSTNGHELTYTAGGEHFGFWFNTAQPSATRFYWLNNDNGNYSRIGNLPEIVPGPNWNYVPPANPGDAPVLQAVVKVPEPAEQEVQKPDSTWMKVYKTTLDTVPDDLQNLLEKLISGDPNDPNYANIVPQGETETETEWELLEGGANPKEAVQEVELEDKDKVVIRRYEFYRYIGPVDDENEPVSTWEELGNPIDPGLDVLDASGAVIFKAERGAFISANMVAAVLGQPVPEPSSLGLALIGLSVFALGRRKR
ncbi:MAG: PEP-CTERM sorting domain-containing protein [Pirellulales bacterium]